MARQFMILAAALLVAFVANVRAACDNACSGHGVCTYDDRCLCYDNWRMGLEEGGDCSDRVCPFDIAWVDNANVDGRSHKYAECSGRGLCDRTSGLCSCFEGYEGKACQRTTCPNDCSGHGRCMYLNELPIGSVYSDGASEDIDVRPIAPGSSMKYWDAEKTRGCVCDATYHGVDCSLRLCPRGTDVLDLRRSVYDVDLQVEQTQIIKLVPFMGTTVDSAFGGRTFALVFKSLLNETFTTEPIYFPSSGETVYGQTGNFYAVHSTTSPYAAPTGASLAYHHSGFAEAIEDALIALPNQVIDDVLVYVYQDYYVARDTGATLAYPYIKIEVTFTGDAVKGPQNLLMVQTDSCDVGCTPKLTGLHVNEVAVNVDGANNHLMLSSVSEKSNEAMFTTDNAYGSEFNSYECGRRGKCDYNTGLCSCFTGYTGEACTVQTALV